MFRSPVKYHAAPQHHEDYNGTSVPKSAKTGQDLASPSKMIVSADRIIRNRGVLVMNSTAQHALENRPDIHCELSSINSSTMAGALEHHGISIIKAKPVSDSPAKIFARLKAKVQWQNLEEPREHALQFPDGQRGTPYPKRHQPEVEDTAQESQETYVLTLSPPKTPKTTPHVGYVMFDADPAADSDGEQVQRCVSDSFSESSILPRKVPPDELSTQRKTSPKALGNGQINRPGLNKSPYVLLEHLEASQFEQSKQTKVVNHVSTSQWGRNKGRCSVFAEMSMREDSEDGADMEEGCEEDRPQGSDMTTQELQRPEQTATSRRECLEPLSDDLPIVMDDPLLLLSPHIRIPRKQAAESKSKKQTEEVDEAEDESTGVKGIHLRHWILKLQIKDIVVDGVRLDNKEPWHSSCIMERVSNNVVKTASGRTYILVGKMAQYKNSPFPSWFLKKFTFGFPEMWKEYLNTFLADEGGSGKRHKKTKSAPSQMQRKLRTKQQTSKHSKAKESVTSSISPASREQPRSAPVSRSGRHIKPPLEYWRGGRITVDSDMNVTVYEDYASTSILVMPKAKPTVIANLRKVKKAPRSSSRPQAKEAGSNEDMLAPRRQVKQQKSQRRHPAEAKTLDDAQWKKSRDTASTSDSGSDPAATSEQPDAQQTQSEKMYLRRGRSYSKERTSTGSESEVTKLNPGASVQGPTFGSNNQTSPEEVSAVQNSQKSKSNRKHLQRVVQSEQPYMSHLHSDTSSPWTRSRVQNSKDPNDLFTPPNPPKRNRRKCLEKQESKDNPPKAITSDVEDSDFHVGKDQGSNLNKRPRRAPKEFDSYVLNKTKFDSLPAEAAKGKKSKQAAKTAPKKTRQRNVASTISAPSEPSKEAKDVPSAKKGNSGKTPQSSVRSKKGNKNERQTGRVSESEQDAPEGTWTDKEMQKLNEAVNMLPKHRRGYWVNVALVVGTRSAEECQEQYTAQHQTQKRSRGKKQKPPNSDQPAAKETAQITAKAGTLKRKKQMWDFLEHIPKDDHDDVFTGSPMQSKQIKLPVWSTNGDEPDFNQLQNPQTPSSSNFSTVKTPQCLHITPGMLGSVNRDNNDKYIYHLQKVKKQRNHRRKSSPKDKFTPVPSVKKTKKRCVAEDDNFVVWNMLSDKDIPSAQDDDEEEDDYFLEEY